MPPRREHREAIPIFPATESSCGSCYGACCRQGVIVPLTKGERDFITDNGGDLFETPFLPPQPSQDGEGRLYYALQENCPFLVETAGQAALCSIYDDPRKPQACGDFEADSDQCRNIQKNQPSFARRVDDDDFMM